MLKAYDVIIIGGGITGAGTARDCAQRGLRTLLVERFDWAYGATGRNHGLLHSGARYAVTDRESAEECIRENQILRRIARHCIEEHDGLFISLPEDDLAYQSLLVDSCLKAGIRAEIIDPAEARLLEPSVNPALTGAVRVPDGSVDPFRLTLANVQDARRYGADTLTFQEVTGLLQQQGRVQGVVLRHSLTGEITQVEASVVVNAAGVWGQRVVEMAGARIQMFPAKGSLLIFGHRVNQMVINRCRKPSNADILVPGDAITVIGTTSDRVPLEEADRLTVTPAEVEVLLKEGTQLAPALATTRVLRAYAGVRPLVAQDGDPTGRSISRGIVCLDHAERDGIEGLVTITGGKLMTYRLMAEMATDVVCRKLHVLRACETAQRPLPGSESLPQRDGTYVDEARINRHGDQASRISKSPSPIVCECEQVSASEVDYAIREWGADRLTPLRRRTRLGMGTCQGQLCALRAAALLADLKGKERALADLAGFTQERWKGMRPVAWGDTLNEAQLIVHIYQGLCGLRRKEDYHEI